MFRRLALSCFFGAGDAAAVEQTLVKCGFTGEPEDEGSEAWVSVFFIDQMTPKMVSHKERAKSETLSFSKSRPMSADVWFLCPHAHTLPRLSSEILI